MNQEKARALTTSMPFRFPKTATLIEAEIGVRMLKAAPPRPRRWYPSPLAGTQNANPLRTEILEALKEGGRMTIREISEVLDIQDQRTSSNINNLIRLGLVERAGKIQAFGPVPAQTYRAAGV